MCTLLKYRPCGGFLTLGYSLMYFMISEELGLCCVVLSMGVDACVMCVNRQEPMRTQNYFDMLCYITVQFSPYSLNLSVKSFITSFTYLL